MKVTKAEQQGDSGVYAVARKFNDELGWIFRKQSDRDLGIDAIIEVVENGNSDGQLIALQIKSGKSWFKEETKNEITFRFDGEHWLYWNQFPLPVFVVLHRPDDGELYWQIINEDTVVSTGGWWKTIIPKENIVSVKNKEDIKSFCDYVVPASSYSVSSERDLSHAAAKRYDVRIILNDRLSKGEIVQVVRKVTNETRDREYYRNNLSRDAWTGRGANVVWVLVFPSFQDDKNNNWICHSQWIDPHLEQQFRPAELVGMDFGGDLVVEWSKNYTASANFYSNSMVNKEDYLGAVKKVFKKVLINVNEAILTTEEYHNGGIGTADYLDKMKRLWRGLDELYMAGSGIGGAPLECKDFALTFQSILASAHNIVLPFSDDGLNLWPEQNRNWLARSAIKDFKKTLPELEYELKKIS